MKRYSKEEEVHELIIMFMNKYDYSGDVQKTVDKNLMIMMYTLYSCNSSEHTGVTCRTVMGWNTLPHVDMFIQSSSLHVGRTVAEMESLSG